MKEYSEIRVGIGYDLHALVPDRPLILGGIRIPHTLGLAGHSDADVLLHAIADAVLGTIGTGDIGTFYPDTDPNCKGMDSSVIVRGVLEQLMNHNGVVTWLDVNILAEKPKLLKHMAQIKESIGLIMGLDPQRISLKAKTSEKLGAIGREEGIAVQAAVTVRISNESR